jgi:hypothetical protein
VNRVLKLMAERTVGKFLLPGTLRSLDYSLNHLRSAIPSRYLVADKAANFQPEGSVPFAVRA